MTERTLAYTVYAALLLGSVALYAWPAMLILGAFGYAVGYWAVAGAWVGASVLVAAGIAGLRSLNRAGLRTENISQDRP